MHHADRSEQRPRDLRRSTLRLLLACTLLGAGVAAAAADLAPISSTVAAVTVKVTPRVLEGPVWEFAVVFDTHSQDLQDDPSRSAVLMAADGSEIAPLEWRGPPPGGHHREGTLRFPAPVPAPSAVVLKIMRAAEPLPRVFRWPLP